MHITLHVHHWNKIKKSDEKVKKLMFDNLFSPQNLWHLQHHYMPWVAIMHFRKWQLIWTEILIKLLYKLFNELKIFSEEYIFLFEKFRVLCVTYGVLQKYLRIACITMIQNELMNSISVYWKKLNRDELYNKKLNRWSL